MPAVSAVSVAMDGEFGSLAAFIPLVSSPCGALASISSFLSASVVTFCAVVAASVVLEVHVDKALTARSSV